MTENLFRTVMTGDLLRCTSSTLNQYKRGETYAVAGTVTKRGARYKVFMEVAGVESAPWLIEPLFNASFERAEEAKDLFGAMRGKEKLRCISRDLGLNEFGEIYEVSGVANNQFGNTLVYVLTKYGEECPWENRAKFNASFEWAEKAAPTEDHPVAGSPTFKLENPKDLIGNTKLGLRHVPLGALYEMAVAMDDGARKYGPFNWRAHPVRADVYVDAAKRHLEAWVHGEERAGDSGGHHLAHAMACMAILLDAQHHSTLKDNRDPNAKNFYDIINQIQKDRDAAKKVLDDKK